MCTNVLLFLLLIQPLALLLLLLLLVLLPLLLLLVLFLLLFLLLVLKQTKNLTDLSLYLLRKVYYLTWIWNTSLGHQLGQQYSE